MRPVALLLEDEEDLLQVLTMALQKALPEVDVRVAGSVAAAKEAIAEVHAAGGSFQLALADHKLAGEGETGLGVLSALRDANPATVAFLFTGQAGADVERQAKAIGVRVLWKPLRLASLIAEVRAALAA